MSFKFTRRGIMSTFVRSKSNSVPFFGKLGIFHFKSYEGWKRYALNRGWMWLTATITFSLLMLNFLHFFWYKYIAKCIRYNLKFMIRELWVLGSTFIAAFSKSLAHGSIGKNKSKNSTWFQRGFGSQGFLNSRSPNSHRGAIFRCDTLNTSRSFSRRSLSLLESKSTLKYY